MSKRKFGAIATRALCAGAMCAIALPAHAQEVMKIGVIASLSGGGTAWGLGLERGVQIAADQINEQGGLKLAGKTYKLEVIPYDDQYNAAQAKTAADRLVNRDEVKVIFGPVGSPGAMGSLPVTQPAKVIQFVDGYTPAILKNEWQGAYVFRINNSTLEFSEPIVDWLKKTYPNAKKVGMIAPNDATGQAGVPILATAYKNKGFDVWTEHYERGTKEFTPLVLRMMAQNVDVFDLNANAPGEAGLLVKQARQVGYKGLIVQSGGAGIDELIAIAGPLANNMLKYDVIDESLPRVQPFVALYHKKYTGVMNGLAPVYYNAANIYFEAMRRADSTDTTRIRDQIEKLGGNYDAPIFGKVVWTGQKNYGVNHQLLHTFVIKEVQNGKATVKAVITP
ncbi:branched chain amino acid ABC transporter periplasmic ligand-binding protein [Caballeronia choica]|uniref:Branched chain amino acid ABC transporter periplasmic ligand-binding protein n=1 Tax=Caballeronia choica TaxID=326476 RepID=A0A158F5U8_9BURK|nr:ABC transporter substrate-binding protein [Caballeronia choica]SAL15232.1 branched chain amino acid ABC transporter periplasmic ligand-binding protein [Caballeronia choica]